MKSGAKTALGVDISQGLICLALLRKKSKGIELVATAGGPVPDGAIEDGRIVDPAALARAVRELKNKNKMRARRAAVSLSVSPVIKCILETPEGTPRNIGQFVQDELKSYVALSGREIAFDFCGVKSGRGSGGRLLAVAADNEEVTELIKTYIRAGLNVEAVEPALISYIRAIYSDKIKGKFDCNVLVALVRDSTLTLGVFRKEMLEMVRVVDIGAEKAEPAELCRRIGAAINTIIQYYEIEIADNVGKWEVTVLVDRVKLSDDAEKMLRTETRNTDLEVISGQSTHQKMIIDNRDRRQGESTLAISLAMGLLNGHETGLNINLVPPESAEVRSVKRQLIMTTIIVVLVIPLLALLTGKGLSLLADKIKGGIESKNQVKVSQDTAALLNEQKFLESQIELLSQKPDGLKAIINSRPSVDWASILDDVKARTPEAVRITALFNKDDNVMSIEGLALSYEAARLFVKMLNESEHLSLASLREATRENSADGLVTYTIDCSLTEDNSKS